MHRIETECKRGALSKRIGGLSEDAIAYALARQDPSAIFALGCDFARQLKRNGIFRSDWSRGLVVAAVDGIEICSSFARSCDHCMEPIRTSAVFGCLSRWAVHVVGQPVPLVHVRNRASPDGSRHSCRRHSSFSETGTVDHGASVGAAQRTRFAVPGVWIAGCINSDSLFLVAVRVQRFCLPPGARRHRPLQFSIQCGRCRWHRSSPSWPLSLFFGPTDHGAACIASIF
jgi:hypothetical protein